MYATNSLRAVRSSKPVDELSIGDQQMVEIAKVLSFKSKVIIMDESNALTDTETKYLFRVIHELKLQRRDIIYNISPYKEIFYICDDVTVFRDEPFIEMVRYKLEIVSTRI